MAYSDFQNAIREEWEARKTKKLEGPGKGKRKRQLESSGTGRGKWKKIQSGS
jgi:hypothetical protein